jgi:Zn-finger nucleic acid-binding protein
MVDNPDYNVSLYDGIKKGIPIFDCYKDLIITYESENGNPWKDLIKYASIDVFKLIINKYSIKSRIEYSKAYENPDNKEEFLKLGMPSYPPSVYGEVVVEELMPSLQKKVNISTQDIIDAHSRLTERAKKFTFIKDGGYTREASALVTSPTNLARLFEVNGLPKIMVKQKDNLDIITIKKMLESGDHSIDSVAEFFGCSSSSVSDLLKNSKNVEINYIPNCRGFKNKKKEIDKIIKEAVEMIDSGKSFNSVSNHFKIMTPQTLQRHYKAYKQSIEKQA